MRPEGADRPPVRAQGADRPPVRAQGADRPPVRVRVLMEPRRGGTYGRILALAQTTEAAGFDAFFRSDHLMGVDPYDPAYAPTDSWTTLGGLARDTKRVRLGTLLTAATYRQPGLLAVTVATLDQMSGGRIELGLGAGWYEREHQAFGIPFPPQGERFERLGEQLAIITGLWATPRGSRFSFAGGHYRLDECANPPVLVQSPHPPIVVGGAGPRRTPALAARYADEFNAAFGGGFRERFDRFRRACEAIGRDPSTARLSVVVPVACGTDQAEAERRSQVIGSPALLAAAARGTPEQVADQLAACKDEGADTIYLHIFDIEDLEHIRLLGAEVLPKLAA
jgi:F420-dependent oxidoreductase-like protein